MYGQLSAPLSFKQSSRELRSVGAPGLGGPKVMSAIRGDKYIVDAYPAAGEAPRAP